MTERFIIFWCVVAVFYNLTVAHYIGPEATISNTICKWAGDYPIIAAAVGCLVGHWFWSQ